MGNDNVTPITPHLSSVNAPPILRALPGWLIWRFEHTAGENKPRKVPYYVNGGRRVGTQGSPSDREKLTTFDAARQAAARKGFDGIGIALLPGFGVSALDFDNCVSPDGIDPIVESLTAGTYTEFSPSGKGIRAFVMGELGDNKDPHPADGTFGVEVFNHKGFVTFTGNVTDTCEMTISETTVAEPVPSLVPYLAQRMTARSRSAGPYSGSDKPVMGLSEPELITLLGSLPDQLDYDTWIKVGMAVHHETQGDGFGIWDAWSSQSPKYTTTEYSNGRWVSFGQNTTAEPSTITYVIRLAQQHGGDPGVDIDTATPDEFEILSELPKLPHGYFGFYTIAEMRARVGTTSWLIKGILPKAELGMLFGASGSGKSFALIDMCAAIARGVDWNGRKVTQGRVLYVVAEGRHGFPDRLEAYCRKHDIDETEVPITYVARNAPNLTDETSVRKFKEEVKQFGPFDLIVLDTFAQVTPGANENSGEDMGKALINARDIGQSVGAMTLLVHHSGKDDSKGARGWSGLKAAADVEIEVSRSPNVLVRSLRVTKMKDGREGFDIGFKLQDIMLRIDEEDEPVTSCFVDYVEQAPRPGKVNQPKGAHERTVLSVVHDLAGLSPDERIPQTELIDAAVAQIPHDSDKRDNRRRDVMRAITSLADGGWVKIDEGVVILEVKSEPQ